MSKGNPRKAMAAILPLPLSCGEWEGAPVVRPVTLGMWAALERIESPLVTGAEPKDALELIPSLYLLTHDPREVFRGNMLDAAMQWADTQPVHVMAAIRNAAYRQMNAVFDVTPEDDGDPSKKKRPTAGWLHSLATLARRIIGGLKTLFGKSPSPRSASSGDRKD